MDAPQEANFIIGGQFGVPPSSTLPFLGSDGYTVVSPKPA
jgi:hypothetical protein